MLGKDQLMAAIAARPTLAIDAPELDGEVRVRMLSENEVAAISQATEDGENATRLRSHFACRALCDAEGRRLFADEEWTTVAELPYALLDRIWCEGGVFSAMRRPDEAEPEKN